MTEPTRSLNPDLDGTTCCTAGCFDVADTITVAEVGIPPEVGAVEETLGLELVLCAEHAHLLRMGATSIDLETDM